MIQRQFVKNGLYQVYNRGNHKGEAFHKADDYEMFLRLAEEFSKKYEIRLISFCLIPNHFHFVLKQSSKLSMMKFMHALGTAYARYYNAKYETVGHVFQGPYRATYIKDENYLETEINYVLHNPEKHGLIDDYCLYRWVGMWDDARLRRLWD